MYWLELQDIMLLIKCFKDPTDNCDISNHVLCPHLQESQVLNITSKTSLVPPVHITSIVTENIVPLWNSLVSKIDLSLPCL